MTSGLRSVRDKAITYFSEVIALKDDQFSKMYQAVNEFGNQVKIVAKEDKSYLEEAGFQFNLFSIIGGQLQDDPEPKLYLLYPQGNWIEIRKGTPFVIIGNTGFGHPVLKRSLHYEDSLDYALKCAFLAFDATRISANDVDFPIDTVMLKNGEYVTQEVRFEQKQLEHISSFWNSRLKSAIAELPSEVLTNPFETAEVLTGKS